MVSEGSTTLSNGASTLGFGTTTVGTPVSLTFTIKNTGDAPLILQPIVVPDGLTVINNLTKNQTVAPGASVTFTIQLNAVAVGTFNFVVDIFDNDPSTPKFKFNLTGIVVA